MKGKGAKKSDTMIMKSMLINRTRKLEISKKIAGKMKSELKKIEMNVLQQGNMAEDSSQIDFFDKLLTGVEDVTVFKAIQKVNNHVLLTTDVPYFPVLIEFNRSVKHGRNGSIHRKRTQKS